MNPIVLGGLFIGVLCAIWTFVMGLTGWYKNPGMMNAFFLVVAIEIGGLIWTLRKTAAQGRTYSGQVVAGTLASIVAAIIIFVSSLAFTQLAYPSFFEDVEPIRREVLRAAGETEPEIDAIVKAMTPFTEASSGAMYTFMTGVVASAVIGLWIRARGPRPSAARV